MRIAIEQCAVIYTAAQSIDEGMGNYVLVRQQIRPKGILPSLSLRFSILIRSRLDVVSIADFGEQVTRLLDAPSIRSVIETAVAQVNHSDFVDRTVTGAVYRELLRLCIEQENQLIVTRIPEEVADAVDVIDNTWALRSMHDSKPRDGFHWQVKHDAVLHESGAHFTVPLKDGNLTIHLSPSLPQPNTGVFELLVYLLAWEIWMRRNSGVFLNGIKDSVSDTIELLIRQVCVNYDLPITAYRGMQRYTIAKLANEHGSFQHGT